MLYVSERKIKRRNSLGSLFDSLSVFRRFAEIDQREDSDAGDPGTSQHSFGEDFTIVGCSDNYDKLVSLRNSGLIIRKRLLYVVEQIALEAIEYGAQEVYIGHPREYRYEFFVDDRGYQGTIEPSDYFGLLKLFGEDPDLLIDVNWPDVDALHLSLTSNYLNPVVHLSWRTPGLDASMVEESEFPQ